MNAYSVCILVYNLPWLYEILSYNLWNTNIIPEKFLHHPDYYSDVCDLPFLKLRKNLLLDNQHIGFHTWVAREVCFKLILVSPTVSITDLLDSPMQIHPKPTPPKQKICQNRHPKQKDDQNRLIPQLYHILHPPLIHWNRFFFNSVSSKVRPV